MSDQRKKKESNWSLKRMTMKTHEYLSAQIYFNRKMAHHELISIYHRFYFMHHAPEFLDFVDKFNNGDTPKT